MNRFLKPIQAVTLLAIIAVLTGCTLGQAAEPTATPVDVNAVMTSAAATAFTQLTEIAGQASPTTAPTQTQPATNTLEATNTPEQGQSAPTLTAPSPFQATDTPVVVFGATPTVPGTGIIATSAPSLTPIPIAVATNSGPTCRNSKFVADVTVPDGTVFKPGEKFTKIWSVQNTGLCTWDQGFGIALWAGDNLHGTNKYFSAGEKVEPGGIVDMAIEMRAPYEPGEYIGHWIMVDDQGQPFGGDLTVVIKVQ